MVGLIEAEESFYEETMKVLASPFLSTRDFYRRMVRYWWTQECHFVPLKSDFVIESAPENLE